MDEISELLDRQDGVISRRQALAAGLTPTQIARLIRRREWTTVHPGVYVHHTGPLTWRQRAWAAVLSCWPAALDGRSALRAHEGPGFRGPTEGPIEVVVDERRRVSPPPGVHLRRSRRYREAVQTNLNPPRLRYEEAILDLADRADDDVAAIAILADACGGRRTTAARLRTRLDQFPRARRRAWLEQILEDVAHGTCSVLEHGYLTLVERPHGLPRGFRQVATTGSAGRPMFRDVVYGGSRPRWRQVVELDGRLFHSSARARDRDLERDLDAALAGEHTVRLGYGQVFSRGCATAARIAAVLRMRGWRGALTPCPQCPPAAHCGGSDQAG